MGTATKPRASTDQRQATIVEGVVRPLGDPDTADTWRAEHVEIAGLPGWTLTVDAQQRPTGSRIVRLELTAKSDDVVLRGEDLRCISPRAILRAMADDWVLDGAPIQQPRPATGERRKRTDDYLRELSAEMMRLQDQPGSSRRALALKFGRTESQVRDDLRRAEQLGFISPAEHGARRRGAATATATIAATEGQGR